MRWDEQCEEQGLMLLVWKTLWYVFRRDNIFLTSKHCVLFTLALLFTYNYVCVALFYFWAFIEEEWLAVCVIKCMVWRNAGLH